MTSAATNPARSAFSKELAALHVKPLWERVMRLKPGTGAVSVGESRWDFSAHDVFVVPSWEHYRFHARTDCVLFSYSDRAAQEALGFWREEQA